MARDWNAVAAKIARQIVEYGRPGKIVLGPALVYPSGRWRVAVAVRPRNEPYQGHFMLDLGSYVSDPEEYGSAIDLADTVWTIRPEDGLTKSETEGLHAAIVRHLKQKFDRVHATSSDLAFARKVCEIFPCEVSRRNFRAIERERRAA